MILKPEEFCSIPIQKTYTHTIFKCLSKHCETKNNICIHNAQCSFLPPFFYWSFRKLLFDDLANCIYF